MIGPGHYLALAAALFALGAVGVVVRRNALVLLMSIELMLNAANLVFLTFARFPLVRVQPNEMLRHGLAGHSTVFFVIAVAAAEAAVGLGIVIAVFRSKETINLDEVIELRN